MTNDDLLIVADDLRYLAQWGPEISDGGIRRESSVLRRLLVEDVYGHAWRAIGKLKQPKLIAVDLSPVVTKEYLSEIVFALAAGAYFRGIQIAYMIVDRGTKPIVDLGPPIRENGYPGEREFTISEFLSSVSGVVEGRIFYRREVIKYIANVKGGVHLSQIQRKAEKKLIARLGKIEKKIMVHTTDGLLVELVAIGQALGNSDDAKDFINYVDNII